MPLYFRLCRALLLGLVFAAFCCPALAAAPDKEAFKAMLRETLKENPDLVLDILKENSELVLDIAQQGNIQRKRKAMLAQWEQDAKAAKVINTQGRAFRGKANAPVTIVAYSDFTCPYCRQAEYIVQQLMKKYEGKVRMTFKPLPKDDPFSQAAAKYCLAAFRLDEAKGWRFFDALFKNTEEYEREGDDFLKKTAAELGFDFKQLYAEAGGAAVQQMLEADSKEADGFGISGTPHFLVNDLLVRGAVSKDLFEEAIQMALRLKGAQ